MEDNVFSSFSFTSSAKSSPRGGSKLKASSASTASRRASFVDSVYPSRRVKDETPGCNLNTADVSRKGSYSSLCFEEEKQERENLEKITPEKVLERGEVGTDGQCEHSLIEVKEEKQGLGLTEIEYPYSPLSGKRKLLQNLEAGFGDDHGDIEDCIWSSQKLSSMQMEKKSTVSSKTTIKEKITLCRTPPSNWLDIVDGIRTMRVTRNAPVDLYGPEQLVDLRADKETRIFHILVAAMLSTQTRDEITAAGMKRLHAMPGGLTIQNVVDPDVSLEVLERLLYPVGFYRQKAKYLKTIAEMLHRSPHCGSVPSTLTELVKLPGVGPKVGLLVLWCGFGKGQEGFICDSNVARVCSRLGWVRENSTPDAVKAALELWLPKSLWPELSYLFVGFGQQICKPVGPLCQICKVSSLCPSAFKCGKRTAKTTKQDHDNVPPRHPVEYTKLAKSRQSK